MNTIFEKLPQKEANKFKQVVQNYDKKKYKKSLKILLQLQKKNQKQSEYKSMQCLIKFFLENDPKNKKTWLAESKKALLKNLKSSFNWQICGLLYRYSKNYKEAAKCFNQALKYSPDNISILRDTTNLFFHSRDYISHLDLRIKTLKNKSGVISNWAGLALAHHLVRNYDDCIDVLNSMIKIQENSKNSNDNLKYNVFLYKASVMYESENFEELVVFLNEKKDKFLNKVFLHEYYSFAYLKLRNFEMVKKHLDYLLKLFPSNKQYIDIFLKVENGSLKEKCDKLKNVYKSYISDFFLIENKDTADEDLSSVFDKMFRKNCDSFSPTFYKKLKRFATTKKRTEIIYKIILSHKESLEKNSKYNNSSEKKDPTCFLFSLLTLSQILYIKKDFIKALEIIEIAIEHTKTYTELYILKSKILKKLGRYNLASENAKYFLKFDEADRCLTKFALRFILKNNEVSLADEKFKDFLTYDKLNEKTIHMLQKYSYENSLGTSYMSKLQFKRALKLFKLSCSHFEEFFDDQYDFYSYSLRGLQLKNLVEILRFNDKNVINLDSYLKSHYKFLKALYLYRNYQDFEIYKKDKKIKYEEENFEMDFVQIDEELEKNLDLSGNKLLEDLNIDQEIDKICKRLVYMDLNKINKKRILKTFEILFKIYIKTDKIYIIIRLLKFLLKEDNKRYFNKIRLFQFNKKIEKLDFKDMEKKKKFVENFKKQILILEKEFNLNYEKSFYKKDLTLSKIINNLVDLNLKEKNENEISEFFYDYYKKNICQDFEKFEIKKKKYLVKFLKEHVFDKTLYLNLYEKKKLGN